MLSTHDIERFNKLALMLGVTPETMVQYLARGAWVEIYDPILFVIAAVVGVVGLLGIARWHGRTDDHSEGENVFACFSALALAGGVVFSGVKVALETREAITAIVSAEAHAVVTILDYMSR